MILCHTFAITAFFAFACASVVILLVLPILDHVVSFVNGIPLESFLFFDSNLSGYFTIQSEVSTLRPAGCPRMQPNTKS